MSKHHIVDQAQHSETKINIFIIPKYLSESTVATKYAKLGKEGLAVLNHKRP